MYKAFQLRLDDGDFADHMAAGRKLNDRAKSAAKACLGTLSEDGEKLEGTTIQDNWFPQIQADVFISHSHADEEKAVGLAGWLAQNFGLKPFVDSCVWGCANDLLKEIDKKHCLNGGGKTYNYDKRNGSTSHVHMMLATALGAMLDRTECLLFINTPNSLTATEATAKTNSPWILHELSLVRVLRRRLDRNVYEIHKEGMRQVVVKKAFEMEHEVDLEALGCLSKDDLDQWKTRYQKLQRGNLEIPNTRLLASLLLTPLDLLYWIAP